MCVLVQAESSTVYMLLEMGAHVNTADHSGETALFKVSQVYVVGLYMQQCVVFVTKLLGGEIIHHL